MNDETVLRSPQALPTLDLSLIVQGFNAIRTYPADSLEFLFPSCLMRNPETFRQGWWIGLINHHHLGPRSKYQRMSVADRAVTHRAVRLSRLGAGYSSTRY